MNKQTRAELERARKLIDEAKDIIDQESADAQDAVSERSEKWLESDKGQAAQEEADAITALADELDNLDFGFLDQ